MSAECNEYLLHEHVRFPKPSPLNRSQAVPQRLLEGEIIRMGRHIVHTSNYPGDSDHIARASETIRRRRNLFCRLLWIQTCIRFDGCQKREEEELLNRLVHMRPFPALSTGCATIQPHTASQLTQLHSPALPDSPVFVQCTGVLCGGTGDSHCSFLFEMLFTDTSF